MPSANLTFKEGSGQRENRIPEQGGRTDGKKIKRNHDGRNSEVCKKKKNMLILAGVLWPFAALGRVGKTHRGETFI